MYIGQTAKDDFVSYWFMHLKRAYQKKYSKRAFYDAIKLYGPENFMFEVLDFCDSKEELDEMEYHYIMQYRTFGGFYDCNGYNMTLGGEGGDTISNHPRKNEIIQQTKEKISGKNCYLFGKHETHPAYGRCGEKHHNFGKKGELFHHHGEKHHQAYHCICKHEDGSIEEFKNIKFWCRNNNFPPTCVNRCLKGEKSEYRNKQFYYYEDYKQSLKEGV